MKTGLVFKAEMADRNADINSALSFNYFFNFLQKRTFTETTVKGKFYQFILDQFELHPDWKNEIELARISEYEFLYELVFTTLFAPLNDEQEVFWGLGLPLNPSTFYSTDKLYQVIKNNIHNGKQIVLLKSDGALNRRRILDGAYSLILERLYDLPVFQTTEVIQGYQEVETGLVRYIRAQLDLRFINVVAIGNLPVLDISLPPSGRLDEATLNVLMNVLPLTNIRFEGFSVMSASDATEFFVLERIREAMTVDNPENLGKVYPEVFSLFQSLLGTNKINFGVFPFIKVNQQLVFALKGRQLSYLVQGAGSAEISEEDFFSFLDQFNKAPSRFFHTTQEDEPSNTLPARIIQQDGMKSLVLLPIQYHGDTIGILELYSTELDISDRRLLSLLDNAITLFAQLIHRTVTDATLFIDRLVKEEFTSLQPSVEWKFKELIWTYIKDCLIGDQQYTIGTVHFHQVHPLYGAIDIRNSTLERTRALKEDLQTQLNALLSILESLEGFARPEELFLKRSVALDFCTRLGDVDVTAEEEMKMTQFLNSEIPSFFNTLSIRVPSTAEITADYCQQVHAGAGIFFESRMKLEKSMQRINSTIADRLLLFQRELAAKFPSYFESFRTDGIEYDIYLGQSIAPMQVFPENVLTDFRLAQLACMLDIINLTGSLTSQLEVPLQTTQLIFVHGHTIDISFRKEERRFDVEGAYNIRYQVMKKRIDKVCLRDSKERLTQPGTVAIVYFGQDSQNEYTGYIQRLEKEMGLPLPVEYLELEELQGVSGLRAMRIIVNGAITTDSQRH